ncbi:MAG: hypothetical protein RL376_1562 [Verrucomicrobiota bacterium]
MSPDQTQLRLPPIPDAVTRLQGCLRALIEDFGAEEVWVYGSVVRGDAGPDSDVDLLVVSAANTRHQISRRLAHLQGTLPLGLNVVTPALWQQHREDRTTLFPEITQKGVCLYARHA